MHASRLHKLAACSPLLARQGVAAGSRAPNLLELSHTNFADTRPSVRLDPLLHPSPVRPISHRRSNHSRRPISSSPLIPKSHLPSRDPPARLGAATWGEDASAPRLSRGHVEHLSTEARRPESLDGGSWSMSTNNRPESSIPYAESLQRERHANPPIANESWQHIGTGKPTEPQPRSQSYANRRRAEKRLELATERRAAPTLIKYELADGLVVLADDDHLLLREEGAAETSISTVRLYDSCHAHSYAATRDFNFRDNVSITPEGLRVQWPPPSGSESFHHVHTYTPDELRVLGDRIQAIEPVLERKYWRDAEHLKTQSGQTLRMSYASLRSQDGTVNEQQLLRLLRQVQQYGLVIVESVPTTETSNEACELRKFANLMGEIRNTFYGETWNVINMPNSKNVAYTNVNLGFHMDLLYFQNPPRFQALHCLRNRVTGGESAFVDAMAVAKDLRDSDVATYNLLARPSTGGIRYEYDNDGHHLSYSHPVIQMERGVNGQQNLEHGIAWSPPFQGVALRRHELASTATHRHKVDEAEYAAIAKFDEMVNRPEARLEFLMQEGDLVFFDNRRILHARKQFRDWTEEERKAKGIEVKEGEPSRWLKGLYVDGDVVWDKLRVLHKKHGATV